MAYTQTDLTAIETAIAEGALEVVKGDRKVRYRSISELLKARDLIMSELAADDDTRPTKQYRVNVSKGIYL